MPFQSEKQRKYLWANEPEIARDWTDTYGSGIAKALGGRIGFANGNYIDPNRIPGRVQRSLTEEDEQSGLWELLKIAGRFITPGGKFNKMGLFPRGRLNFNFNRNRPTPAQQSANQNYMNQQRITRDPQTGRMIGGNFAGQNAPGTSFFGSQTFPQMAQKWALKNQNRVYKTPEMQQKQQNIINTATGGRDPRQGNTVTGHGKSGMGRDPRDRMAQGGLASLWQR